MASRSMTKHKIVLADFASTGLRVSSTLQLHRLMTVTTTLIQRELGALPPTMQRQASQYLRNLFDLK
jgi:mRNA interferase MazF